MAEFIAGWAAAQDGVRDPGHLLDRLVAARPLPQEKAATAIAGRAALAAPEGHLAQDGMLLAAFTGRPRWQDEKLAAMAQERGMAAALIEGWRRFGRDLAARLSGLYSIAVVDGESGDGVFATDRAGCHPLAWTTTAQGTGFATSVQSLRAFPGVDDRILPQTLLTYLFFYVMPSPVTIHAGIAKLRPAEAAVLKGGKAEIVTYHAIRYATETTRSVDDLAGELRETLRAATGRAVEGLDLATTGAFLSGGLDSSTVTAFLAERAEKVRSFTIGFHEPGYDESGYARIVSDAFHTDHTEYFVTPQDVAALIPQIPGMYDEPYGNHSAVPAYYCARAAREAGVDVMLAGDGGDELFAGNERYVTILKYGWYRKLPKLVRNALIEPVCRIPGCRNIPPLRQAAGLVRFANTPLPDRLHIFDFFMKEAVSEVFSRETLADLDLDAVLDLTRATYRAPAGGGPVQRLMHMDMAITLADNDLRKVNRMTALAGVGVRFPMLDDALIDFAATIPDKTLLLNGALRGFYKYALRETLPAAVIEKTKHGFGLPFRRWVKTDPVLKEMVDQALTDFEKRHLLKPEFTARVRESHHNPNETLVDGFAWDIMMLELWMRHWRRDEEPRQ